MAAKKEKSFEERLLALEETVKQMEAGNMSLSDTLKAYEQGEKLADSLKKQGIPVADGVLQVEDMVREVKRLAASV